MKIQVLSDLHVDFGVYKFNNKCNADVLVLAGDCSNGGLIKSSFEKQSLFSMYKHVIMISGNHEYYNSKNKISRSKYSSKYRKEIKLTIFNQ